MKFFKEKIMGGCTDYVAYHIYSIEPLSGIRVTFWDDYGYRGIERAMVYDDTAGTVITEAEFFDHYGKALIAFQDLLQSAPTIQDGRQ